EPLEGRTLLSFSSLVAPGPDGHLAYVADAQGNTIPDFSNVGYLSGTVALPGTPGAADIPVRGDPTRSIVTALNNPTGDDGPRIQKAIDYVSSLPVGSDGYRGAVLLKAGDYYLKSFVTISHSGVVLRGEGQGSTVLHAVGTDMRYDPQNPMADGIIRIQGDPTGFGPPPIDPASPLAGIVDTYVPVGAHSFHVTSTTGLNMGDRVIVHRPSPLNWLQDIGMNSAAIGKTSWQPGQIDLDSDRVITAIDPVHNLITVDAPLTNALEQKYGESLPHSTGPIYAGWVYRYRFTEVRDPVTDKILQPGRIDHVGVENLSGVSEYDPKLANPNAVDKNGQKIPLEDQHA